MKIPLTRFEVVGHRLPGAEKTMPARVQHAPLSKRVVWRLTHQPLRRLAHQLPLFKVRRVDTPVFTYLTNFPVKGVSAGTMSMTTLGSFGKLDADVLQMILCYAPLETLVALEKVNLHLNHSIQAFRNSAPYAEKRMAQTGEALTHLAKNSRTLDAFRMLAKATLQRTDKAGIDLNRMSKEQGDAVLAILQDMPALERCRLCPSVIDEAFTKAVNAITEKNAALDLELDLREGSSLSGAMERLQDLRGLTRLRASDKPGVAGFVPTSSLKMLELTHCRVTDDDATAIARCTSLVQVALAGNADLRGGGIRRLVEGLPNLQYLDLRNNGLLPRDLVALRRNGAIRTLILDDNACFDGGAIHLADHTACRKLSLRNNGIGTAGAKALAQNRHTLDLNLADNVIEDDGAAALIGNDVIRHLDLSDNVLNSAQKMIGALASSHTLETLRLNDNTFDDMQLKQLIQAAGKCKSLKLLDLQRIHCSLNESEIGEAISRVRKERPDLEIRCTVQAQPAPAS